MDLGPRLRGGDDAGARGGDELSPQQTYAQRCAMCHDHPQGSIPPREVLARRSKAHIVDVLTNGAMRPYAQGLDAAQVEALAEYLR